MEPTRANPLLSAQKASDSGLLAVLHPLVLLTISDYITRHTLRHQEGPVVGALIGQQNGREVTIEHAFECATNANGNDVLLDREWFAKRLIQMKTIHKSPQLDLVGWYTLLPKSGPTEAILPIHHYLLQEYNESSLLLSFHPDEAVQHSAGSRLPVTIYESLHEADDSRPDQGEDKEMRDGEPPLKLRFRELPYSVETGEAEMISMDFVARGGGNATAIEPTTQQNAATGSDVKGKQRMDAVDSQVKDADAYVDGQEHVLSREDEELVAALTGKMNSIKMLQSRINLMATYLERLPPSYLSGSDDAAAPVSTAESPTTPSHPVLRSIQALVNRLPLVLPANTEAYEQEMLSEANDVHLMELLNDVMQSVAEARGIGKKYAIVEGGKAHNRKNVESPAASFDLAL
ncbi:COP9 signalosome complex subunit 6 [Xylariaceae sp. FL0804]|nr:COP9 signalosome complex subunit 6 [Xylariaceae sp. FL0804]